MMNIKLTGHHMANRHPVTGVRYTIYHINNELHPEVWDDIYRDGGESVELVDARSEAVTKAAEALRELGFGKWTVENCLDILSDDFAEGYECDEPTYEGETDGIKWVVTWLGGAPHLTVLESPYYGVGRECSPCVPNALCSSTITAIFSDEDAAGCHASVAGGVYGYALPTTWLRDKED